MLGLEHLESTNEGRQYLQDVYDSGESGMKLLDQLLQFSHQESNVMELVSLGDIVESSMGLLAILACESVKLEVNICPDMAQLQQLIMNISINAFYAMSSCPNACLKIDVTSELDPSVDQLFIVLRLKDNGVGILDEHKDKIFLLAKRVAVDLDCRLSKRLLIIIREPLS